MAASLASADSIGPTDLKKYKDAPVRQIAAPDPTEAEVEPPAPVAYPLVDRVLYEKSGRFIDDQWRILAMPDWRLLLCLGMMVFSLRFLKMRREQDRLVLAKVISMPERHGFRGPEEVREAA